MAITFSFKKKKKEEPEKYHFPAITQKPYSGEKHSVAKFALNKAALKAMGYPEDLKDCKISVAMDDVSEEIVLINSTGSVTDHQFNVNMDGTVNSKFLMERVTKFFGHSPVEEVDFILQQAMDEDSGFSVFYLEALGMESDGNDYINCNGCDCEEKYPEKYPEEEDHNEPSESLLMKKALEDDYNTNY